MIKLSKILKVKGMGFILLAFAAGIILLVLPEKEEKSSEPVVSSLQYINSLESSLEELLENLSGHKCSIMLTLENGYSYTYAADEKLDTIYNEGEITSKNVSKEYVKISNGENESLVVLKENLPQVKGVAVVCRKGDSSDKEKIISVICSLFDLSPENVGCVIGK